MHWFVRPRWGLIGITLFGLVSSLITIGCQPPEVPKTTVSPEPLAGEFWEAIFMQRSKVGYTHTTIEPLSEDGHPFVKFTAETKLSLARYGEKNEQTLQMEAVETPAGHLIRFTTNTAFGPTPVLTTGNVEGGKLIIESSQQGKTQTTTLPWTAEDRGFFWMEQTFRARPMIVGEHRSSRTLLPIMNQLATIKLIARGVEPVKLLDGKTHNLMRIDSVTTLDDGNIINSTVWADEHGEALKSQTDAMQQETYRVSKQVAITEGPAGEFDLGIDSMVKIAPPLVHPHESKQIRYGVELASSDPTKAFANCPSQTVQPISEHVAEVTVRAIRPDLPSQTPAGVVPPVDADRLPNAFVQSDDPRVIALAKEAAPPDLDEWKMAIALEKFVHDTILKKNFSQAFASAAEVAESREGDCTEHAVLLAALLRARGIPARVAIGLVYVIPDEAFGYHMWTEAFIGDRWIPLDATLGRGGIGGGHLKLLDTNLEGASAYGSFLPVAQVLGRLKIKVLAEE